MDKDSAFKKFFDLALVDPTMADLAMIDDFFSIDVVNNVDVVDNTNPENTDFGEMSIEELDEDKEKDIDISEETDPDGTNIWSYDNDLEDQHANKSKDYLRAFRPRMDITYSSQADDVEYDDSFDFDDHAFLVDSYEPSISSELKSSGYSPTGNEINFEEYYLVDVLDTQEVGTSYTISNNGVLSLDYDAPTLINGQRTYQRIVFEADVDGESVYDMTKRRFRQSGIETKSIYDNELDSMLFTSINGMVEGNGGNFNEFYLNGAIGADAVDKKTLSKGDIIEWRFAEETDGSCGGVPDQDEIGELLGSNQWKRGLYSGKNWGSYLPVVDRY